MISCTLLNEPYELLPTTTIADIKEYIFEMGYDPKTSKLKLGDGTLISPVVFTSNDYDEVNFIKYKNVLKGSILIMGEKLDPIEKIREKLKTRI